jgi:two-component system LytT family response regulator
MKLLITDNEPAIRQGIKQLIAYYCPEIEAIAEAGGVKEGLEQIELFKPDILLLDVEMDDGTGFDLLQLLNSPGFQLIFATAHNKYAIDAFQHSAIDYLLKPVDGELLQKSIQKAINQIRTKGLDKQIEILLQQLTGKSVTDKKLVLKDLDNIYFVKIADILYALAEGTYTRFYIDHMKPVTVSKNLKEYENILEPAGFIRTHHSYLVNPDKIVRFDKKDGGSLILSSGEAIPLSKRKKDTVIQVLGGR